VGLLTAVVLVPGASVRKDGYQRLYELVQRRLAAYGQQFNVVPCCWGQAHGAVLGAGGLSIPEAERARSIGRMEMDQETAIWALLYSDPLMELRLAAELAGSSTMLPLGQQSPRTLLDQRFRLLEIPQQFREELRDAGISEELFARACQNVWTTAEYHEALNVAARTAGELPDALARAVVAMAMTMVWDADEALEPPLDGSTRDAFVEQLVLALQVTYRSGSRFVFKQLAKLALTAATGYVGRRREAMMNAMHPFIGDILLYQSNGSNIRSFITSCIEQASDPVVVLAHSLGGIAAIDLLAVRQMTQVELLVNVGSPAPYFYEFGVLRGVPFGAPLPDHFPAWQNIYGRQDLFSFVAEPLFPGRVQDICIDTRQPFPYVHSAYWRSSQMWDAILPSFP
jgi:hypothetical protein